MADEIIKEFQERNLWAVFWWYFLCD